MPMVLQEDNNERRDIDKQTTEEALTIIDHDTLHPDLVTTVVYQSHWHKGVIGIVASRLIEHHYRPTIVLTHSNGKISGSARSIKGFNLFEGLTACASYLDTFGGHYFAAGLTLSEEHLEGFRSRFDAVVRETLAPEFFEPEIEIDAELQLSEINPSFVNILKQFAPHGPENMTPVFLTRQVKDFQLRTTVVKDKHIRFQIQQHGSVVFTGIGFNMAEKIHLVKNKESFDIIYHIDENEWNGLTRIQLRVLDIR
jgi:single-stranded-DNA-specific exonuclease